MISSVCKIIVDIIFAFAIYLFNSGMATLVVQSLSEAHTVGASSIAYSADSDSLMTELEYYSKLQAADEVTFKQDLEMYFLFLLDCSGSV